MTISRNILIKTTFALSICIVFIGFILKFSHSNSADILLIIGLIAGLFFIVLALHEIFSSTRLSTKEKIMWLIGIILLSYIGGFIFLLAFRKHWTN